MKRWNRMLIALSPLYPARPASELSQKLRQDMSFRLGGDDF
ncbi:hypothetical protein [Lactobacillus delbrueckii]|nr:hypothetical protein [Lactobacillus delbrueckii]